MPTYQTATVASSGEKLSTRYPTGTERRTITGRGTVSAPSFARVWALASLKTAISFGREPREAMRETTARRRTGSSRTSPSKAVMERAAARMAPERVRVADADSCRTVSAPAPSDDAEGVASAGLGGEAIRLPMTAPSASREMAAKAAATPRPRPRRSCRSGWRPMSRPGIATSPCARGSRRTGRSPAPRRRGRRRVRR